MYVRTEHLLFALGRSPNYATFCHVACSGAGGMHPYCTSKPKLDTAHSLRVST